MKIGVDTRFLVQLMVREHPSHGQARALLRNHLENGDRFAMAPQVVGEFIHVVSDPKRFERPLSMDEALARSESLRNSRDVCHVHPTDQTMLLFWKWMERFQLGRMRILDTLLAATYYSGQIPAIMTSNVRDFGSSGCLQICSPE